MERLIDQSYLKKISNLISDYHNIALPKLNSHSYVVDNRKEFLIDANPNYLTSISRLAAIDQTCGSLYFEKNCNLFFATNTPQTPDFTFFRGRKTEFKDSFALVIKPALEIIIANSFTKKAKEIFIQDNFNSVIKKKAIKYRMLFLKVAKDESYSSSEREISNLISNQLIEKKDWKDFTFDLIISIYDQMRNFLKNSGPRETKKLEFYFAIENILIYFDDLLKTLNVKDSEFRYKNELIEVLGKPGPLQRAKCSGSKKTHCEMRIFEHVARKLSNGELNSKSYNDILEAFQEERFTVSKFCCWFCRNVIVSIREILGENEDFDGLGNSNAVFAGWESPMFGKNYNFQKIQNNLQKIITNRLSEWSNFARSIAISSENMNIENSEITHLCQQIMSD